MIKYRSYFFILVFVLVLIVPASAKTDYKPGDPLRIKTSKTLLKKSHKPFGSKIIDTLKRGATVFYLTTKGSWFKVEYKDNQGYIPKNSLVEAKKFKSFSRTSMVTQSDMAAATKGFSPQVERKNRENRALRYDLMDKAEARSSVPKPLKSLKSFRKQGSLGEFQ